MIKRNGVELMNARTKNVSIAKETLAILKQKYYISPNGEKIDISIVLDEAVSGTILYKDDLSCDPERKLVPTTIEVTNETTANTAQRFLNSGKNNVVVLNFASATSPGGGFLAGSVAQEEDLCRCSGLYPCIKNKPVFYNENILCGNTYYTDNIIYSPKVPFIRNEYLQLLEEPFLVSVITSPAPNIRSI